MAFVRDVLLPLVISYFLTKYLMFFQNQLQVDVIYNDFKKSFDSVDLINHCCLGLGPILASDISWSKCLVFSPKFFMYRLESHRGGICSIVPHPVFIFH